MNLPIDVLPHGEGLPLPKYETAGSAGFDLRAAIDAPMIVYVNGRTLIPCGFRMAIPEGYEGQIRPRSGLALKHGITVANAPGTVDSDYRGELAVILINHGDSAFSVTRGMRIAQLVIAPVVQITPDPLADLCETERGAGGFGHTGVE
jgi:dUTP pyrophosphatase